MKYCILVIVLFFASCQDVKRPEAPDNLISEDQMVEIMTDAYLMNAARSIDIRAIRREGILLDSIIFSKFNIDSLQFAKSNAYYTNDLNAYKDIFLEVEQRLITEKAKRDTLYEIFKADKAKLKRQDSIYRAKIDSMAIEKPEISKDSLEILLDLDIANKALKNDMIQMNLISQDSLL